MDYSGKIIKKTPVTPSQTSASGVWTLDDAAQAQRTNTWPVANVPNPISRSLRFRKSASAYLNRTPASAGNRQKFTISTWLKRSELDSGSGYHIFSSGPNTASDRSTFEFSSNQLYAEFNVSGTWYTLTTNAIYRDPSAWYHIVVAVDTTQATDTNRVKIYVNGSQITSLATATYPPQNTSTSFNNTVAHGIGYYTPSSAGFFDGYMTEFNWIDGQALTPSSFGGTNAVTGVWEPRQYTGTYGTNGFYLNFKDNTSTTTLGYDYSGNSNNWTTNNISLTAGSTYDSMLDVPTQWVGYNTGDAASVTRGNYCVLNPLNPLIADLGVTLSNGNLTASGSSYSATVYTASMQLPSSGKWYYEFSFSTLSPVAVVGIRSYTTGSTDVQYRSDGQKAVGGTVTSYGSSWTTGDVIGVAIDVGAGTVTFYKNGVSQGAISIPTPTAIFDFAWNFLSPFGSATFSANFGQRPFSYTPPAGFTSLCTTNLPSPTILQGNQYFDVNTWTGTGATNAITNSGSMQPDFIWIKDRSRTSSNDLVDVLRGVNKALISDATTAEYTGSFVSSFNSNGFSLPANTLSDNFYTNISGDAFVGWQWKANGAGGSNTDGSITSTVSANTTAGFSIATFTATGSNATVGHGLGVAPAMIITKQRSTTGSWATYHESLGNTKLIYLNSTGAALGPSSAYWNNTSPTSTVFTFGGALASNGDTMVAYCFAAVSGYSAFGSYTGNGSTDGPFVYCGFRPKFVMVKRTSDTGSWLVYDSARNTYNPEDLYLLPNSSGAEGTSTYFDFLSNGFKLRTTDGGGNGSGSTYMYMAFAENPFKNSLAR